MGTSRMTIDAKQLLESLVQADNPTQLLDNLYEKSTGSEMNTLHESVQALCDLGCISIPLWADNKPYNNDPFMMVYSAQTIVSKQLIQNVFSTIENRLLDALILLEKEFGSLDNLDIDTTTKTPDEIERIEQSVYIMIFNDNSVTIGNNNRFKNTDINTHGE